MSKKSQDQMDREYVMLGLRIAGDFGVTIAVPVIAFVFAGRWLDAKYDTGILLTILAFILSALLSGLSIYKKANRYGKEYMNIEKRYKTENQN